MANTFLSGSNGKAFFNAELNVTGWTFERRVDALETTHSGSGGVEQSIAGVKRYRGTVEANFDGDQAPTDATPNVKEGAAGTLKLYTDATKYYELPVLITRLELASEVEGLVRYRFAWQGTGAVTERAS